MAGEEGVNLGEEHEVAGVARIIGAAHDQAGIEQYVGWETAKATIHLVDILEGVATHPQTRRPAILRPTCQTRVEGAPKG